MSHPTIYKFRYEKLNWLVWKQYIDILDVSGEVERTVSNRIPFFDVPGEERGYREKL